MRRHRRGFEEGDEAVLPGTTWPMAWVRARACHEVHRLALRVRACVHVDVGDTRRWLQPDLDDFGRVVDSASDSSRGVNQAVDTTEIDKRRVTMEEATPGTWRFCRVCRKFVRTSD